MKIVNKIMSFRNLLACMVMIFPITVFSEISIVVHPSNDATFSEKDIKKIFLVKKKRYSTGNTIVVMERSRGTDIKKEFTRDVLNKTDYQLKAYWSRLIFTGKAMPPKETVDEIEVRKLVSENPAIISYIDSTSVDSSVKVIRTY